ncbi:E3 ubiquitin-protein ligase SHPRH-like isoform X2 [Dysidea avara]|uniref:E3 ubiquitin-protein ligase SHPRH-like isoform X2 n=1 Tax=Dysidea avara TaxID=196820 RepID=UPI0033230EB5
MPRRKRPARPIEAAQPACKKVFKSPLINFNLLEKEITNTVPVTTGRDNTEGLLCIGTFDLCFSHSRVILIHQEEEEYEKEEASPCLKRALIVVEDEAVFLATWEDATLQLLKVTGLPDKELMRSLSNLHHKGLSLHITGTPSLLEMFPCKTCTSVTIDVMITGDLLVTSDPFEVPRASFRERAFYLHPLIRWLHPDFSELTECEVEYYTSGWNVALVIDEFYRRNKWRTSAECFDWYNLNVRGVGLHIAEKMFCILRPYQWRAVGWMLAREGVIVSDKTTTRIETELLDTLWSKFATNGDGVYYNRHTARFCKQLLPAGDQMTVSGGILADEMGLGKTVEVLALILANQWTGHDEHLVNQLQQQVEPLKGEGLGPACPTLAMAPPTLNERPEVVTCRQVSNSLDENQAAAHIIACVCGAMTANNYAGAWVSCDACELWYHAPCVKFDMEKQQEFVCVRCLYRPENPVACGSTLIVSPVSIAEQWLNEIDKHIKPDILKVLYYRGIKLDGYITPPEMATYDIVLTTYEVLKTEVYFSDNQKEFSRVLRHPKKYLPPRTPLSLLHWWRICLDEAQMIEGKYTNAARMVQQLSASHRWCVTGTPLQQGVHDLYGLLFFLRVEPYVADAWWKKLLWRPFLEGNWAPMLKTCSKLLWRNSKRDVADELRLPPHSECVHWLHFLPVERHFYRKTLEQSEDEFEQMIQKFCGDDGALCNFANKTVSMLLAPLRQLRQSCCHPQLVKGGYLMGTGSTRGHVTMAKLLEQLTKKARNEVIEALRVLVTSCNGIAAVHQIKHEWQEAADMYHHVMQTWEEHTNDVISVDRLPRIHTMENLADLLDTHSDSISGRTTRDDDLRSEAKKLRDEYLAKFRGAVAVSVATLQSAKAHCKEVKEKLPDSDYWWNKALSWSCDAGVSDRLMQVVGTELDTIPGHPQTLMIRDMSGLQLVLLQEAEKLEECREEAIHLTSTLLATPSAEEVEEIAACHLRPLEPAPPTVCKFCKVDQVIQQLQDLVYMKMVYNTGEEYSSKADGFLERLLKCIHSFIKYQCGAQDVINEAKDYFALIDAFKKEFKAIREVWLASHGHVAALDELDMSTTRLQLRHSCDRSDSLHLLASYETGPPECIDRFHCILLMFSYSNRTCSP